MLLLPKTSKNSNMMDSMKPQIKQLNNEMNHFNGDNKDAVIFKNTKPTQNLGTFQNLINAADEAKTKQSKWINYDKKVYDEPKEDMSPHDKKLRSLNEKHKKVFKSLMNNSKKGCVPELVPKMRKIC